MFVEGQIVSVPSILCSCFKGVLDNFSWCPCNTWMESFKVRLFTGDLVMVNTTEISTMPSRSSCCLALLKASRRAI